MKNLRKHLRKNLEDLKKIERSKHHPLIHLIHKKHNVSKKTLFYVKEYGPHSNIPKRIIKESLKILLLASIVSSFGGFALEYIKTIFVSILPLVILLPVLNDMIGDYASITSAKIATLLHEGELKKKFLFNPHIKKLFYQLFIISMFTAILSASAAQVISLISQYPENILVVSKVFLVALVDVLILVSFLFFVSVYAGMYFYEKGEDPNNFLIPITTSFADFGNMLILAILIILFF